MHRLNFSDHRRKLNENQYVYAVVSRRSKGLSIGINLNPDKSCNFACPYCQVDRTIPGGNRNINLVQLRSELRHLFSLIQSGKLWDVAPFNTAAVDYRRVNDVAFAGDGEPTACPTFSEAVSVVVEERNQAGFHDVQLLLLTNATLFHRQKIIDGLNEFWTAEGVVWAKLDAGTEQWFRRVDGTKIPFKRVLDNILWASMKTPIVLQCMFHRFEEERPSEQEILVWGQRIAHIIDSGGEISSIQVYTTARKSALASVLPLNRLELDNIASVAQEVISLRHVKTEVLVYE
jgi:wyosine [tRNA(Phe)-imidazoG37] synthetase (radical SAM superfamily)